MKHDEQVYLDFDVMQDDRETQVHLQKVKLVKTRKKHECYGTGPGKFHDMPVGTMARRDSALIDREHWGSYYICTDCIDTFLEEFPECLE